MDSDLTGRFILVVDDEELLREIVIDELTRNGAHALGVENGQQAIEALRRKSFDAVITDLTMSGGDGLTLITEIQKSIDPKPKIFLFSGSDNFTDEEIRSLGVSALFGKPFDLGVMMQKIASSLEIT